MKRNTMEVLHKMLLWTVIISFSFVWGIATALAEEDATLTSLTISGSNSVNESSSASYTATAKFSDGSTRAVTSRATWSENSSYASIAAGVLTTGAVSSNQTVTITARYSYEGISKTAQKAVTIANVATPVGDDDDGASLSSLSISGSSSVNESSSATYTATAKFSDGSTRTVTSRASWSENSSYASISGGVLTTRAVSSNQTVTITARYYYNGISKTAQKAVTIVNNTSTVTLSGLTISGPSSVAGGSPATYTATATFSNGTTQNVTSGATWSENSTYTTIASGVLTTTTVTSNQTVTVGASYTSGGITRTASFSVTVTAAAPTVTLSSLAITGPSSVAGGSPATYTATATFSNGTTQNVTSGATWSENSTYTTIASGVLTTTTVTSNQTVTVGASYTSGGITRTASFSVTVTAAAPTVTLSSLAITGPSSVAGGSPATYTATATFSNGTTQNVTSGATWSENSTYTTIASGVLTTTTVTSNQAVTVGASYTSGGITRTASFSVTVTAAAPTVTLMGLTISGPTSIAANSSGAYTATANFSNATTQNVTTATTWSDNSTYATIASNGVMTTLAPTTNQSVTISASYTSGGINKTATFAMTITAATPPPPTGAKSINSTSQGRATLPTAAVPEQARTTLSGFNILPVNDLGMHCGDLDHRIASILPPFNVLHAQVIQKGTSTAPPEILTSTDLDVVYSASSNPNDPALLNPTAAPVYKTNFWDQNPAQPSVSIAFGGYDPFYPPNILSLFPLPQDMGLPVPDLAQLYPVSGASVLTADQQQMPGLSAPYTANTPQSFKRFDTDLPFFAGFPFGYRLTTMNWFAADGIPVAPFDDFGRKNSYPLMRVQAKTKSTTLTGRAGDVIASVDSVIPVSGEAICYTCHTSATDGGGGYAACIPGVDANCATQGSPRSGTAFVVARAADDASSLSLDAKKEWAADNNIIRLHDAKHGTHLQSSTPVVCQTCHYTPALDLAHLGPLGPGDANANGRDQRVHRTNSRVMHAYHGQFTDLFPNDMPPPTDSRRINSTTKKPVVNAFVEGKLNASCYQCHPGKSTKCLRGAMFNGGLICQDCHGNMQQVGNDFSQNFSASTPFPAGADLTKRIPWANVPECQSCHTGDAMSNLGLTDPNVIKSTDGIRLIQAYRTNDTNAKPIVATNKRFAEQVVNGNQVLYRLSKGHSGVACESCHGSTHAEWPVLPESGTSISNDNMAATQMQGHTGKIVECTTCHTAGSLSVSLGGPHGMHPVGDSRFVSGHSNLAGSSRAQCQACHGQTGQGTVLSKVAINRTVGSRTFTKGQLVSCGTCHGNPL